MNISIITTGCRLDLHGFSGIAMNKDYAGTAFRLMDGMWRVIKEKKLNNKGLNVWVYEPGEKVFAGVELNEMPANDVGLEHKLIVLPKYAYYKHTGPYHLIKQSGQQMIEELEKRGIEITVPYIEIYGHWTEEESKLETELLMGVR